ncbi:MAG: methionyl-tRNA formyltransferase [Proteobacteria bacterium]|nr:methionyl-tRNA formyltransferase [Pseudomonadota bacterium]
MALDPTTTLPAQPLERPLRVAFFGTPALAVPTLDGLLARPDLCEVVAVVAQPDKPAGRKRKLRPPPVALRAKEAGLTLFQPRKVRSGPFPESIEALDLDLAVVIAYGRILTTRLLEAPRFGCVNVHASLLPAYRGAGPIQWAIIRGETETGITTMWMEEGLDTGPMLLRRAIPIGDEDTAGTLGGKLSQLGADLLVETVQTLKAGALTATQQSEEGLSHAPLLSKDDGRLNWSRPARELASLVRGVAPWPGAWCGFRGDTLKVHAAVAIDAWEDAAAGSVLRVDDDGVLVRCGDGGLLLTRLQPPGRKAQDAADFVRGYRPTVGERFDLVDEP